MTDKKRISKKVEDLKRMLSGRIENINLTERDRKLIMFVTGFFILLIIYMLIFSFGSAVNNLEKKAAKLQQDVLKVKELKTEYLNSSNTLKRLMKGSKRRSTPLISEVEKIILDENIDRKNFSIKDKQVRDQDEDVIYDERAVDVDIKNVPLNKMIDILYNVQTRPSNLKIGGLRLKTRFDNSNSVDVYFRVSAFEFKEVA